MNIAINIASIRCYYTLDDKSIDQPAQYNREEQIHSNIIRN